MIKKIYAPWRSKYLSKNSQTTVSCIFCSHYKDTDDKKNYILHRLPNCMIMLNLYPYNAGHILIVPNMHVSNLNQLTKDIRSEIMEATNIGSIILKEKLKCDGINIGLNMGEYSGGSIPEHLHMHVVPRWASDTNFLVTTASTKAISFDLNEIYKLLTPEFKK